MVMHARKPQRIGDGYFEKHQAHPYQNSKYSSSKGSYDRERVRDSPNGNSYRSDSPECDSPRLYHGKSYKSRDRDYKSRDKYSDCVRSPKEKRSRLDSDHRTNHDRNSSEKMLLNSVKISSQSRDTSQRKVSSSCQEKGRGDWSEHVSSSGKKYYYNCKTEVSQWEKPREWLRHYHHSSSSSNQSNNSASSRSQQPGLEKHSNCRGGSSGGTKVVSGGGSCRNVQYWHQQPPHVADPRKHHEVTNSGVGSSGGDGQATDMEICSGQSTPTSETCYTPGGDATPQQVVPAASTAAATVPAALPPLLPASTTSSTPSPHRPQEEERGGPPTPTQENQCGGGVGEGGGGVVSEVKVGSWGGGGLSGAALSAACLPSWPHHHLTPSLANHYREDLLAHVKAWPAHLIEVQAQKLSEEAYQLGIMCARVSAELKCPRSLVRQTEIQATRQEQRVLFLRQQIKTLEELKSQNSFMGDET